MTHIFWIDDIAGKSKHLLLQLLNEHKPDIKVHFFAVVPENERKTTTEICDKFKNSFEEDTHYFKGTQTKDGVYSSKVITYKCNAKHIYTSGEADTILKEISDEIKTRTNGEPFSVAVDMLLFGDGRGSDQKMIEGNPVAKILSHSICENYLGQCGVFTSAPDDAPANFEKWRTALSNPHNKEVPHESRYDSSANFSDFFDDLFNLAK